MPEINGVMLPFLPAGGVGELNRQTFPAERKVSNSTFKDVFSNELNKLKFSGHAQSRMKSRDIELTEQDMTRLTNAVGRAEEKGAGEALILLEDKSFIVNIPNKTVITAALQSQLESSVITNIDSAVFA
ncbi:MAG: Flagellar operon protein [Ignavibacteria bacterium]|nr:Flagellar operon protein [Ignavibacteria bacterium]